LLCGRHSATVDHRRRRGIGHSGQAGYATLLSFVAERAPSRRCWALEGTGCYGAGLASFLLEQGEWVIEIDRPKRTARTQAKSDPLDAIRAVLP